MKKKFTEAQIVFALRQAESGTPIAEIIRKMEISEVTFYRWKKKWLGTKGRRVRLFYLPGYRPDLNPDEYLNQDVKSNAVGRRRPPDVETMRKDISGYLRGRQRRPQIVMNYFKHESVHYAS